MRIGDRGLRLVVCGSHPSVRVRGQHLDLLARLALGDLHAIARSAGTPLTLARPARTHACIAQQVLGTIRATLG